MQGLAKPNGQRAACGTKGTPYIFYHTLCALFLTLEVLPNGQICRLAATNCSKTLSEQSAQYLMVSSHLPARHHKWLAALDCKSSRLRDHTWITDKSSQHSLERSEACCCMSFGDYGHMMTCLSWMRAVIQRHTGCLDVVRSRTFLCVVPAPGVAPASLIEQAQEVLRLREQQQQPTSLPALDLTQLERSVSAVQPVAVCRLSAGAYLAFSMCLALNPLSCPDLPRTSHQQLRAAG